jgi:preprotein translocase subunit SecD
MVDLRDNLRIIMLVALCVLATLSLFGPLGASSGATGMNDSGQSFSDPTNLQYGLDLAGGTQVRGQLVGQTAEDLEFAPGDAGQIVREVSDELGVEEIDVRVHADSQEVELFRSSENISAETFADALTAAGVDASASDIRDGTTDDTREDAVETLTERIDRTGLSGSSVTTTSSATGEDFIIVEVPGEDRETVEELIGDPGRVQVIAGYPSDDANETGPVMEELLEQDDFEDVIGARSDDTGTYVSVRLTSSAADRFADRMIETGFTGVGQGRCDFDPSTDEPSPNEYCLYTVVDGEIVHGAAMGNLAETLEAGNFDGQFRINTQSFADAQELEVNLQSGALPSEFSIQSSNFISPSTAQQFKPLALLTALLAWLAVSIVVYFWYRDVRVAVPMLLTAGAEVFLLLGFASAIGMALDLSHIAGFIAVIGTGVDDLIIMADEILQRKQEVKTGRIFQSRFRKAFWIIGMAAATTIIAMSPLAVLSLGDLRGFAIVTIVGVIIGVAVTRPAYGDVLRNLILDDVKRK